MDFASGEAMVGQMIRKFIRAVGLKIGADNWQRR